MTSTPPTRPTLLFRIRNARDQEAWERFIDLYAPLVYGFLRKRGLQDADAADLTQDVLRQVALAANSLEYDPRNGTFRSWLFTIVQNRLIDHWRREGVRERATGDSVAQRLLEEQPQAGVNESADGDWDTDYSRQLFHYAAKIVKQDFTPSTWQAFWRTAVDGLPGPMVAEQLGLSLAAVYLAKGRVLNRLKEQVKQLVGEE
ncbi:MULTISPECIES: RNA polymerase sigma factor [unclassified Schlesneria]|uniref:RNA polymerase sigma factor n=1 Tax=Schlesneria TaxID=656899 RepID=UPI002EF54CB3